MSNGELSAVFKALAEDADRAAGNIAESVAGLAERTADTEEANLARTLEAEAATARSFAEITEGTAVDRTVRGGGDAGRGTGPGAGPSAGPPWPVAEGTPGPANGRDLSPPHPRHTVAGARGGMVRPENSVILRGNEAAVREDVRQIAAGNAPWDAQTQRYVINGRSYGVERSGTVFPDSGPGIAKLDRNEYAALKELARAGGDPSRVPQFTRDPRFTNNPTAIAKAKAIYDGTYSP